MATCPERHPRALDGHRRRPRPRPAGWQEAMDRDPSEQVLRRAGFAYEGESEFSVAHRWSLESLTGLVYSGSSLNREALGERVDDFEADLRGQLLSCCPDGV